MAKSPEEMAESMIRNLQEKTGRSLDAWVAAVGRQKLAKHGEIVKWLKGEHGMGHGYANLVAHYALAGPKGADVDLVAAQYSGTKAGLRPIYDAVIAAVGKFGGDVEIAPKKTYVSLRRSKQFALVQASTATRVDVGIQLKGEVAPQRVGERLEASGSFNAMVSHRVRISGKSEVDRELVGWLRAAYERA
jgi:predicted transport protein